MEEEVKKEDSYVFSLVSLFLKLYVIISNHG